MIVFCLQNKNNDENENTQGGAQTIEEFSKGDSTNTLPSKKQWRSWKKDSEILDCFYQREWYWKWIS